LKSPNKNITFAVFFSLLCSPALSTAEPDSRTDKVFQKHCASCHGADRLGGMGPALLPENLSRLRTKKAIQVIKKGRVATQMPAFERTLSDNVIAGLVDYIYQKPDKAPVWSLDQITKSQLIHFKQGSLPNKAVFDADLMNLFIVVEIGDHHATLLNGDTFEPIHRFKTRFALHGGPKFSPDGRFVYFASRDGWISKYDIYNLKTVAEIRAGINTRNLAVSSDGKTLMVANYLPHTLVMLNTDDLSPIKLIEVKGADGTSSRVSAVYNAPPRNSYIAALKDLKEVWEIPYANLGTLNAPKITIRKIAVKDYLDDFFFDPAYEHLIGASRDEKQGQVINLTQGKQVADIDLLGMPHLGSGITWSYKGREVMATPHLKEATVSIIDMTTWKVIKKIPTLGPGFFMRSHENSPYAWVDVFFGPNKEAVHIIDKQTLEIVKTLKPVPGKTAAHVEFTKNGSHVLLSIWDMDGEVIVYDAKTLEPIKRLPMVKPSGKYNVFNKTTYSRGTSH